MTGGCTGQVGPHGLPVVQSSVPQNGYYWPAPGQSVFTPSNDTTCFVNCAGGAWTEIHILGYIKSTDAVPNSWPGVGINGGCPGYTQGSGTPYGYVVTTCSGGNKRYVVMQLSNAAQDAALVSEASLKNPTEQTQAQLIAGLQQGLNGGNKQVIQLLGQMLDALNDIDKNLSAGSVPSDLATAINNLRTALGNALSANQKTAASGQIGAVSSATPVKVDFPDSMNVDVMNPVEVSKVDSLPDQAVISDVTAGMKAYDDPGYWQSGFNEMTAGVVPQEETPPNTVGGDWYDSQKEDVGGPLSNFKSAMLSTGIFQLTANIGIDTSAVSTQLCIPAMWGGSAACVDVAIWQVQFQAIGNLLFAVTCICAVLLIFGI